MASKRKSWQEKLHNGRVPIVEKVDKPFGDIPTGAKMLIPTPEMVDEYVRNIGEGKEGNLPQMRKDFAAEYQVDFTCPITSGIFLRIVAEAAYEEYMNGKPIAKITPFWRMLNAKSPTVKKLTFGYDFIAEQRRKENLSA